MNQVTISLTPGQEITLMDRYGRRCSRQTLVERAVTEVLKLQAKGKPPAVSTAKAKVKEKAEPTAQTPKGDTDAS